MDGTVQDILVSLGFELYSGSTQNFNKTFQFSNLYLDLKHGLCIRI